MPDGSTRTDPEQWWHDPVAREASGFVESEVLPEDLEPPPPAVPPTVSARQIRLWLVGHGIGLDAVDAAIDAIPDESQRGVVRIEWEYAPYVERSHPMLVPLGESLGMTPEQIDAAFIEASTL